MLLDSSTGTIHYLLNKLKTHHRLHWPGDVIFISKYALSLTFIALYQWQSRMQNWFHCNALRHYNFDLHWAPQIEHIKKLKQVFRMGRRMQAYMICVVHTVKRYWFWSFIIIYKVSFVGYLWLSSFIIIWSIRFDFDYEKLNSPTFTWLWMFFNRW